MACESGSGIVPRAGGNRGDVHDRRRHAIAAGATAGAIALCWHAAFKSRPCAAGAGAAKRNRTLAGCPGFCSTARISRARRVLAARKVPWPRRYHDAHGNLHMHVYFYMISYLLHAPRSYHYLDCAFYRHTRYKHDTASIQHMHRYDITTSTNMTLSSSCPPVCT